MLGLNENSKLKIITIILASILIFIVGYSIYQKTVEKSNNKVNEEENKVEEDNNKNNEDIPVEVENDKIEEKDELETENKVEGIIEEDKIEEIKKYIYYDIEIYDKKLNGQKVYEIEFPKANFTYNDYTTNAYNDNIIFESYNNIPEFSPKIKNGILYLQIDNIDYKVNLNKKIKKVIKGKICSSVIDCKQLIVLTEDGEIYVNYPYLTYSKEELYKQFNIDDLKFIKVDSDKKFIDVAIVCPETDFDLGLYKFFAIVGKTNDETEYLFGNSFHDKYNLGEYKQDYVHLILGHTLGVLKINEDATISHININNVNEVISYNGVPIYFNIGFSDGIRVYVIDRQGYLYTISEPYSNMRITKGNKIVKKLEYAIKKYNNEISLLYEDDTKEIFNNVDIGEFIKEDSRYKKIIVEK